eukprot:4264505-Amphidinium_carterae.1
MVGVARAPTEACEYARQEPTPDKGTWTAWLYQFMMHDVQMVSDFQPTHQQRLLTTCATTELASRQCCFAQFLPNGWPARHTVCDAARAVPNMSITPSTAAS